MAWNEDAAHRDSMGNVWLEVARALEARKEEAIVSYLKASWICT